MRKHYFNAIRQSKTYSGADINSDHSAVICTMHVQLKGLIQQKGTKKLDYAIVLESKEMKEKYNIEVRNRSEVLDREEGGTKWEIFKEAVVTSAKVVIPGKENNG